MNNDEILLKFVISIFFKSYSLSMISFHYLNKLFQIKKTERKFLY